MITKKVRRPEAKLEDKVRRLCKAEGVMCFKFTSPQRRGVPDRLLIFPGGRHIYLELKAPGGKLTDNQSREIARLRNQGCKVYVLNNIESVNFMLDMVKNNRTFTIEDQG